MEQLVLHVAGMGCTSCEQRIQKAIARLEGVRSSAADHRSGEVRVVFDPSRISPEAVRACIVHAGYDVSR